MKIKIAMLSAALLMSSNAMAAAAQYVTVDHSPGFPLDAAVVKALWAGDASAKVLKLYPPKLWGFLTEIDGGFDKENTCVLTTRVTMLPLNVTRKTLIYKPKKTMSTFGILPKATKEQCVELATSKLKESIHAMMAILATDP